MGYYKVWIKLNLKKLIQALNKNLGRFLNLAIYDYKLIKNCQLYTLDKLVSKEL